MNKDRKSAGRHGKYTHVIILLLLALVFVTPVFLYPENKSVEETPSPAFSFTAESEDGFILISWENIRRNDLLYTQISISDGTDSFSEQFSSNQSFYKF